MDSCSEGVSLEGYHLEFFDLAFVWLRSDGESLKLEGVRTSE